jgi:toxin ParE1/3/4
MTYDFHPEARLEYREAAVFYESRRPGLGAAFSLEVEATIRRILEGPEKWRRLEQDVRTCRTRTFPYTILYSLEADSMLIVAVMHLRRATVGVSPGEYEIWVEAWWDAAAVSGNGEGDAGAISGSDIPRDEPRESARTNNHFHAVVETPEPNLVDGMKWFWGTCTSRFNRRHRVVGHLFSGRYKALPVDGIGPGYLKRRL